jgi:hypothetical protein
MTKKLVASIVLLMIALFALWYGYQEYKKYQQGSQVFIESAQ